MMNASRKACWRLLFVMTAMFGLPTPAGAELGARVWKLDVVNANADGTARLSFGLPETDDTLIRLSCAPESGLLDVLILHTQQRMGRGSEATARLMAGGTRWSIRGKIIRNDESLDESFSGRAAFEPSRFLRLAAADRLLISVGAGPAQSAPLGGSGEKFRQFAVFCAKP